MTGHVEGVDLERVKFDQMDLMVEVLGAKSVERKKMKEKKTSDSYGKPSEELSTQMSQIQMDRPRLIPVDHNMNFQVESQRALVGFREVSKFVKKSKATDLTTSEGWQEKKENAIQNFSRQHKEAQSLVERTEKQIEEVRGSSGDKNVRIAAEESNQVVTSLLKTENKEESVPLMSLEKMGRMLAFLEGVIMRLDLLFRLYDENSPLQSWFKEVGIPDQVFRSFRNTMASLLLGENAAGFAQFDFRGLMEGEEFGQMVAETSKSYNRELLYSQLSTNVEQISRELVEYMCEEEKEVQRALEIAKFIVCLLFLLLLLLLEALYSKGGEEKEEETGAPSSLPLQQGETTLSFIEKKARGEAISKAYQMVETITGEAEGNQIAKQEQSTEETLDIAMVKAINSMLYKTLSDEKKSKEEFREMFDNVTGSIDHLFEVELQAINLTVQSSA